jgi:hypothetical protein
MGFENVEAQPCLLKAGEHFPKVLKMFLPSGRKDTDVVYKNYHVFVEEALQDVRH